MESEDKCELLANKIQKILRGGLTLTPDVVHYVDSTFSNPTIQELATILEDDSNCEKDSLAELLFFPDESIQTELEALLESLHFQQQDAEHILNFLYQEPFNISLHFPDERGSLNFEVPKFIADQFMSRLDISKHLHPKLLEAINHCADVSEKNRFKVKFRNSRFLPTKNKIRFLCDFFEKANTQAHDILNCLDFVLDFMDEIKEDNDIYQALMAKKKFYLQSLQKAKHMNDRLQKHNVETLLLQGNRVVLIDAADVRKKMLMIDEICRAIFGKTEYFEPA